MIRAPIAWVLNLDAELELEMGTRHTPSASLVRAMDAARRELRAMLPPGDVVLDIDPDACARGLEGRCFCPTPAALQRLERAAARVPDAPSPNILKRVNERGFAYSIHHLEGSSRCTSEDEVVAAIARPGRWLLKRGLGTAGRGQRRIDAGAATPSDVAWIRASLRRGALYVEPRVEIALEVALHGWLAKDGTCERGIPCVQVVKNGAWRGSRPADPGELREHELSELHAAFDRTCSALREARYFGPFGIDAFRYATAEGETGFQPLSEINARYTMAWGVGMAGWR